MMQIPQADSIELTMPARAELLVLARLHAGTAGGLLDLNVDEIDDLRLAVEELCLWALDQREAGEERLRVVLTWSDEAIGASCQLVRDATATPSRNGQVEGPSALSQRILDALVDEHGISEDDGLWTAWFRTSRPAR